MYNSVDFSPFPASRISGIPPFEILPAVHARAGLLVCDHASPEVPPDLHGLGLVPSDRLRHIAWDIGAAEATRRLVERLDLPAVLAGVSRLVIDCNRSLGDPTLVCQRSDGSPVPGNRGLGDAGLRERVAGWFEPYHLAIDRQLADIEARGDTAALIAIHSFTPEMNGQSRPWEVGVLWNRDSRIARPLMEGLVAGGVVVGDNQPYSGRRENYTMKRHGEAFGRPHVLIELRQDLVETPEGAREWADRLADILDPLLDDPALRRPW